MQGRNTLVALLVAMAVFMLWVRFIGPRIFPVQPVPPTTQPDEAPPPPATQPVATQPDQPGVTTQQTVTDGIAGITVAPPTTQPTEADLTLGALEPGGPFRMQVRLTTRGAGVRQALLADYFMAPRSQEHYAMIAETADGSAAMAGDWIELAGQRIDLSAVQWSLTSAPAVEGAQSVRFVARISRGDQPLVDIFKTFTLAANDYELQVGYEIVNRSGEPLAGVSIGGSGARSLPQEGLKEDRSVMWYVRDRGMERKAREEIIASAQAVQTPTTGEGLLWAATDNRFFAIVIRPSQVAADVQFTIQPMGTDRARSPVQLQWNSGRFELAAADPGRFAFAGFFGPKDSDIFAGKRIYQEARYTSLIDYGGACPCSALCGTTWLAPGMLWLLRAFYWITHNYGIAIILLVALVRILLHPLTKKSQVSMSKMSKLQPKIEEIKKKYAKDPAEMNKAMAEFYRQEGFSPFLGCLPMLLQMPIWVALWAGLNTAVELRHAPFMLWINDLAAPDALYAWTTPAAAQPLPIPFIGDLLGPLYAFNLLPILLMIAMFGQQMLTPRPAGAQAGQHKFMMYFMTIFFGLLFYNMPSGLTLYVMASTAVGVGEQYVIRKHIREQEEAEKRGELPKKKEPRTPLGPRRKRK